LRQTKMREVPYYDPFLQETSGYSGSRSLESFQAQARRHVARVRAEYNYFDIVAMDQTGKYGFQSQSGVFENIRVGWTASHSKGTGQTYLVILRTDIIWDRVRVGGDARGVGKTNAEAARRWGLRPELVDGTFATLHHIGQDARGPLVEASTRYHGIGQPGHDSIHSIYGRSSTHSDFPVDRYKFDRFDTPEYWQWREQNR